MNDAWADMINALEPIVRQELEGCQIRADDGTVLYTPDGQGNYPALWTRDFAYMLEYAGGHIPLRRAVACVETLLRGARAEDGWIPDRVDRSGTAVYAAGSPQAPCGRPNLDNGSFLVLAADACLSRMNASRAASTFLFWQPALLAGMACLPRSARGLIDNPVEDPHSPYGFTDCIAKTGELLMESVLFWRVCHGLAVWQDRCGLSAAWAQESARAIEGCLADVFMNSEGMLDAATKDCAQTDVWGSCYAVSVGFPFKEEARRAIGNWLIAHREGILQDGQLRHTAPGETWQRLLADIPPGTYQNGAYWATATGWFAQAVAPWVPALAFEALDDATRYFLEEGVYECVNGAYRKLDHYVASVTNVYGAARVLARRVNSPK